ncbi:MAG: aromatic amino acid DMT transporter YddG [Lentisphaeria bacterium]
MNDSSGHPSLDTGCGILAVVIWSAAICLSRSLMEKLGTFTGGGLVFTISGVLSILLFLALHRFDWRGLRPAPAYLLACGVPFVLYVICLYLAVGLARNRQQVVEVGLLNYLWPAMTLLLSVPVLKLRARPWLPLGLVMAFAGVVWANVAMSGQPFSVQGIRDRVAADATPYVLALAAAVLWGLYSNLVRRFAARGSVLGVPLFMLAGGLLLLGAGRCVPAAPPHWSGAALAELAAMVLFPSIAAYLLWDRAMRRGNLVLVASVAYLAPLLSTLWTGWYLGVPLPAGIWGAGALIVAGAWLSKTAVRESLAPLAP